MEQHGIAETTGGPNSLRPVRREDSWPLNRWTGVPLLAALLVVCTISGCSIRRARVKQNIQQAGFESRPEARLESDATSASEKPHSRNPLSFRTADVWDRLRGVTDSAELKERARHERLYSGRGQTELGQANKLFESGSLKDAVRRYKLVAKNYSDSSIGEEAQFRLAESYYRMSKFSWAQDAYHQLFEDYPSTRYMDESTHKLFSIARYWLGDLPITKEGDGTIRLVSHTDEDIDPKSAEKPKRFDPTLRVPVLPNFHDRTRPVFDTKGRALEALRTIWLSDPTGPLADDALMATATHYLNKGDYVESDRYFKILRDEYPKSPHLEDAFVLGSHVKLMSYQGALYDGTALSEAESLKKNTLRLFPDNRSSERIRAELAKVEEQAALREWELVDFYRRKNKPRAMAIQCMQVIQNHPESRFVDRARATLRTLDPKEIGDLPGIAAFLPSRSQ